MSQIQARPLFVVGPSRSGTTLVQSVINGSGSVYVSGETHYFDDLRDRMPGKGRTSLSGESLDECEKYFLALSHRPYGHHGDPELGSVSREELRRRAVVQGGSGDDFLEAYCRMEAEEAGATEWGEKTPRHVYRIADIIDSFPEARFVCVMRDPRGVVASYKTWHYRGGFKFDNDQEHEAAMRADYGRARRSYNLLIASLMWSSAAKAIAAAQELYGAERIYTLSYEGLVSAPERATKDLADWMAAEWSPEMLTVPFTNSSTADHASEGGFSLEPSRKWESILSQAEIGAIQTICAKEMGQMGYAIHPGGRSIALLLRELAFLPVSVIRGILANRSRMVRIFPYVIRRIPFRAPGRWQPHKTVVTAKAKG